MIMPFGQHRGQEVGNLPPDYLEWLTTIELRPRLKAAVQRALNIEPEHQPETSLAALDIGRWYRHLSTQFHPDHGGHPKAMAAIRLIHFTCRSIANAEVSRPMSEARYLERKAMEP